MLHDAIRIGRDHAARLRVSKIMPTIDELGTIFVTFGWMVR